MMGPFRLFPARGLMPWKWTSPARTPLPTPRQLSSSYLPVTGHDPLLETPYSRQVPSPAQLFYVKGLTGVWEGPAPRTGWCLRWGCSAVTPTILPWRPGISFGEVWALASCRPADSGASSLSLSRHLAEEAWGEASDRVRTPSLPEGHPPSRPSGQHTVGAACGRVLLTHSIQLQRPEHFSACPLPVAVRAVLRET